MVVPASVLPVSDRDPEAVIPLGGGEDENVEVIAGDNKAGLFARPRSKPV